MSLLIIASSQDVHAQYVSDLLNAAGIEHRYLPMEFPTGYVMSVTEPEHDWMLETTTGPLHGSEIQAVWARKWFPAVGPSAFQADVRRYVERESNDLLDSLPNLLDHAYWLNHPDAERIASRKPYQLMLAARLGFTIPATYLGNDPNVAGRFVEKHPEVALKALSRAGGFFFPNGTIGRLRQTTQYLLELLPAYLRTHWEAMREFSQERWRGYFTRILDPETRHSQLQAIRLCPVILQAYIPKQFELRITVVGQQVFACAIDSQSDADSRVDWRKKREETGYVEHRAFDLPPEIERLCLAYLNALGLEFGCFDFIVTPDNEYVFLEVNSSGQWLWIEQLTGMPIGQAIADQLIAHCAPMA